METVYIETSIVSYLVAEPTRDLITAAHQQATHDWWDNRRSSFQCTTSAETLAEAARGDARQAALRMAALAAMPVLVEYLLPLLRVGGKAVIQKGETGPAEAHAAEEALRILGGKLEQIIPVELPRVVESRYLIVVQKNAATPLKYPRRVGIPTKRPLGNNQAVDS